MTVPFTAVPILVIPENAPFTPEQRAWLSGFLAATLLPDAQAATALGGDEAANLIADASTAPPLASNDEAPWHDPAMILPKRMKLAEGKAPAPRLMAAMAQQDCGQCGYNCADYANAIFEKREARLNLCAPGGKETARMLRDLAQELGAKDATPTLAAEPATPTIAGALGRCREQPIEAVLCTRTRLSGVQSEKDTWHVEFDLAEAGLDYCVGDSFGVFPQNDFGLVDQIIAMLGAAHTTALRDRTLRDVLAKDVALGVAPDSLFELLSYLCGGKLKEKARALARGEDPDGDAAHL
ncbi:MAG TPA: (Fe-S)-binding protein, partial [Beijerinckiaceae bacterium]|nr:(Fe-S)-binding protein [Beijerinckiaceae bacterium]